ncbi:MAG: glycosyltransferase family 4 protein [Flavobacteriaceae bacterium]
MKIIISSNVHWSIYNFRLDLIKKLILEGFEIIAIGKEDGYSEKLRLAGVKVVRLNINNNSINPLADLFLLLKYIVIYRSLKANIILHNAIKPNIYGTMAAWILHIPVVNNISGLGTIFINGGFKSRVAQFMYRVTQKRAAHVFFQNKTDLDFFRSNKMIHNHRSSLIPGSGVDTSKFIPVSNKNLNIPTFIFVGRFLKQKGILELIDAAEALAKEKEIFKIKLIGKPYLDNESSLSEKEIERILENPIFEVTDFTDDVLKEYHSSNYLILPSYREGLSRVLLEAGSCGLPSITTDVPGCKDVIINDFNGLLIKPKNSKELKQAMRNMLIMKPSEKEKMSRNARLHVVENFGIEKVLNSYLNIINSLLEINR